METNTKIKTSVWCGYCKEKIESDFYIVEGFGKYRTNFHIECFKFLYKDEPEYIQDMLDLSGIKNEFE